MYHSVDHRRGDPRRELVPPHEAGLFEAQVRFLAKHYRVVPAAGLQDAVRARRRGQRFPAAITFDDDLACHESISLPILRRCGVTATFFLSGASLDRPFSFHFERLQRAHDAGVPGLPAVVTGVAQTAGPSSVHELALAMVEMPPDELDQAAERLLAAARARPRERWDPAGRGTGALGRGDDRRLPHVPPRRLDRPHAGAARRSHGARSRGACRGRPRAGRRHRVSGRQVLTIASPTLHARRASASATRRSVPRSRLPRMRSYSGESGRRCTPSARSRSKPRSRSSIAEAGDPVRLRNALLLEGGSALDATDHAGDVHDPLGRERAVAHGESRRGRGSGRHRAGRSAPPALAGPARLWPRATQRVKRARSSSTPCRLGRLAVLLGRGSPSPGRRRARRSAACSRRA